MVVRLSERNGDMRSITNLHFTRQKRGSITTDATSRKRRKVEGPQTPQSPSTNSVKQFKVNIAAYRTQGIPLSFGVGDMGQLGLGPDITERSRPSRLNTTSLKCLDLTEEDIETFIVQVCAGGVHTVCLTINGDVITCGCNDEGALGRKTNTDKDENMEVSVKLVDTVETEKDIDSYPIVEENRFGYVRFPVKCKIIMVSAGDSHAAALDSTGKVWLWGTFRGSSGPIGLTYPGEICPIPRPLLAYPVDLMNGTFDTLTTGTTFRSSNTSHLTPNARVVKIVSGQDHLVCLTDDGKLYTMGCGEQGQLGRVAERFAKDGGRSGIASLLQPTECRVRGAVRFSDTWAGSFATFAKCQATGAIYACGLNNYGQLSLVDSMNQERLLSVLFGSDNEQSKQTMDVDIGITSLRAEEGVGLDPNKFGDAVADHENADKSEAKLIAIQGPLIQFMLNRAFGFDPVEGWIKFAVSMHHTLALNKHGHVYAIGRTDYGRLGLGSVSSRSQNGTITTPTRIRGLLDKVTCSWIGCGDTSSFAVDLQECLFDDPLHSRECRPDAFFYCDSDKTLRTNRIESLAIQSPICKAYSWGMGSNQQLGHGDDDEDCFEPGMIQGKQLQNRRVLMVDAGGQHTVLLARSLDLDQVYFGQDGVHLPNVSNQLHYNLISNANRVNDEIQFSVNHSDYKQTQLLSKHEQKFLTGPDNDTCNRNVSHDELVAQTMHMIHPNGEITAKPILIAPIGAGAPQTRRAARRASPSSLTGSIVTTTTATTMLGGGPVIFSSESTTGSTAGATINSSVHSSVVSDTSSVGSCASNSSSSSSQLNSAKSTDGGGSSRCSSSFDTYSVQSSLLLLPLAEDASNTVCNGPIMSNNVQIRSQPRDFGPMAASILASECTTNVTSSGSNTVTYNSSISVGQRMVSRIRSGEMSICSTSSELGIPTDTLSLGSMTASPADVNCGDQSSN